MHLTQRERMKLDITVAAIVARRRLDRGVAALQARELARDVEAEPSGRALAALAERTLARRRRAGDRDRDGPVRGVEQQVGGIGALEDKGPIQAPIDLSR